MKKPRFYKSLSEYVDNRITTNKANDFDIVKELWQEVQELKQDLSMYQEIVMNNYPNRKENRNDNRHNKIK